MALDFLKKAAPAANQAAQKTPQNTSAPKKTGPSFLLRGKAAREAIAHDEQAAAVRKEQQGKLWRFRMKDGESRRVTFLDGEIGEDGMLDIPHVQEHTIHFGGNDYKNFICIMQEEGVCAICEKGDSRPALVGLMTVVDRTAYKVTKGANAGKIQQDNKRLFVAKGLTLKDLTKKAQKRGGLTGCTFDVSRTGDKSAAVGSSFDFEQKQDLAEIAKEIGCKVEDLQPADYEKELVYHTNEELVELGIGKALTGPGTEKGVVDTKSLAKQL